MRVDFYQLQRDPVEAVLPQIARNTLKAGERLLVVSGDEAQLSRIDEALWTRVPDSFIGHGRAGQGVDDRQPVLLSADLHPANGARFAAIADGVWREAEPAFARTFYFFDDASLQGARECWKALGERDGLERHFWKQQGGKWVEAG
jgi:DNA polymerase-3 subunit chi